MPLPIEDYALLGDTQAACLVGKNGSIDWWCVPRFDSSACFAALLGDEKHGRWLLAPVETERLKVTRRYRGASLVLETTFETPDGVVRVVDCMPPRDRTPDIVRVVEGVSGTVAMQMELVIRFDYGSVVPWVRKLPGGELLAVGGPDALSLRTPVATEGRGLTTVAAFEVRADQRVPFVLSWHPSHEPSPSGSDALAAVGSTESWWEEWARDCDYRGPWEEPVRRSLSVLKALTYAPTGGMVAAPTTSLPEQLGGVRNWDYRYCWLRDATFTLFALTSAGYHEEASAWRDWLLRSVAGDPAKLQIMYGVGGERRLPEWTVDWLPGYQGAKPVRVGNAAVAQLQLDVYGEVIDALHQSRRHGIGPDDAAWNLQRTLVEFLETAWHQPDEGLWEVRGPRQHFTHSKVMAWVAFDRAVKAVEQFGAGGPVDRWRALRDDIHADVCAHGWDSSKNSFTQAFGSARLDASLLLIPQVGFLPIGDPRVVGTVAAIERELLRGGFVMRYRIEGQEQVDGLPPGEGAFLACTFWLVDAYAMMGRAEEARRLFESLLALRNDVGLLSEEYDPHSRRLVGNFPQSFSHVGIINSALALTPRQPGPAEDRART